MRHLLIVLLSALALPSVLACGPSGLPVPSVAPSPQGIAAPNDFDGVKAALETRDVDLRIPTSAEAAPAMPEAAFMPILQRHLADEPAARIVSINLVVVDVDSARLQLDSVLTFAVETTGHPTGNCISLYDAATAASILGACFFTGRTRP